MPKSKQKTGRGPELDTSQKNPSQGRSSSQGATQSQSATQAEKALLYFNPADVDRRVNDLVKFFLIQDQKKFPIKKQDINKCVLKEFSQAAPVIIDRAKQLLIDAFGINLIELEGKQKGSYMLVNTIETDSENPHLQWNLEDNTKTGLLMVILSVVFMNGNVITDGELWHTLKKLRVESDRPHKVFGDVKRLVTSEFVRQGYLEYNRRPNTEPPTYEFKWGWRSRKETSKRNMLDFVSQIYDLDPTHFNSQWQDMLMAESPRPDDGNEL